MPEVEDRREKETREAEAQLRVELERVSEAAQAEFRKKLEISLRRFAAAEAAFESLTMQRAVDMVISSRERDHDLPAWVIVTLAFLTTVGIGAGVFILAPDRSSAALILFVLMVVAGVLAFTLSFASADRTTS